MRVWQAILATALTSLGFFLLPAANAAELKQDKDFRLIDPPLATEASKVEVTEFFWYGCPHCFDFEPVLAAWVKKLPADVSFRRIPTIFPNDKWAPGARLYYTLEAMNQLDRMHGEVFRTIHVDRQRLDDEKDMLEWAARKGLDARRFKETWSSFGVQSRVQQARRLTQEAGLTGVPTVMVHGRYLALTQGNYGDLIANIEQLIARVRTETGGGKR